MSRKDVLLRRTNIKKKKKNFIELGRNKMKLSEIILKCFDVHKSNWRTFFRDRIKRLKLRHCGKLDFTCNGKLWLPQFIYWGAVVQEGDKTSKAEMPQWPKGRKLRLPRSTWGCHAVHEAPQYTRKRLLCTAAAAVHNLVYSGTLMCSGATVGVDALQYKPFYTVPFFCSSKSSIFIDYYNDFFYKFFACSG